MALPKEVIPQGPAKRCPKCNKVTLTFDTENNRIVCSACGFEQRLRA